MRLSEAFCHKPDEPGIEVRCRVYNINPDNNRTLKERSAVLEGYTYFVEKVRNHQKGNMSLEEAVDRAIEDCIENHVLEDFFRDRKDEVKKMTHLDYTWEKREQMIRKEEFEDGMEQEKRNTAARMVKLQIPLEQIAQAVGESVETVESWLKEA